MKKIRPASTAEHVIERLARNREKEEREREDYVVLDSSPYDCNDNGVDVEYGYESDEDDEESADFEDYNDLWEDKRKFSDIADKLMTYLESIEQESFILLEDDEIRKWWGARKATLARRAAKKAEKERLVRVKNEALAKLTAEEIRVLGVKV